MPDYTAGKARILLEPTARGFFTKAKASLRADAGSKRLEQDVLLRPVATRFRADADAQLRTIRGINYQVNLRPNISNRSLFRADAKAQAETHLKGLYATMTVRGMVDMTYANNQLRAWRAKEEAKPLRIRVITEHVGGVGRPGGGAAAGMVRALDRPLQPSQTFAFGHNVPILSPKVDDTEVKRGVEKMKRDVERPANQPRIRPKIDEGSVQDELRKLRRAFQPRRLPGPSIRGVELLAPAMLSIASESAPALVAALGGVVAAIEEMSGAALAAPGALAVLGTSLGTLALGVSGIKAAWKALTQEQDRSSNQASADADKYNHTQEQMRHALVDQRKAQMDLTKARKDARRELEDLHSEERSSYLSVAEAALDLQKARNELAQPTEGPLDRDEKILRELRAREALSEAIRKQGRAREDTADADRKGIEGSDRVTQAQEALVRSNEQVADSLKAIQEGSSGAAGAADKVKAAMADLSPNAAALTKTLFDLRESALKPLGRVVSQNMFAGMSDGIKALVSADLPLLTNGFGRVATAINRNLTTAVGAVNTDQNRGVLARIFGNTEEFHKRFNAAIDPAIRSLGTLAAVGSDAMPRLATQFAHLADRFANFIDKADKEGRLDKWINRGIDSIESMARSVGHVISTLHSVGQAFGQGLIPWIERTTKKMDDFFKSGRGQNDLLNVIHLIHQELDDWRPILQDLPTIFGAMAVGIRGAMGGVLPVLNAITSTLRFMPGLSGAVVQAFITWRAFNPILAAASAGLTGVSRGLQQIPGVASRSKASMKSVTDEAAMMSTGFVNVGRKAGDAERDGGNAMQRLGGRVRNGATSAVRGLSSAMSGAAAFMTGPWGAAIVVALGFLEQLIAKNHDAADAADAQRQAEEKLAGSLEQVTNAAGASTRAALGQELENYQPQQGLTGNVRAAAEGRGINRDRLLQALLPGGQGQATDIYQGIRKDLRQPIIDAAGKGVVNTLAGQGFSEDNLVDAYLGDRDQLARLQDIMNRPQMKLPPQAGGLMGFNLTDITKKLPTQSQQGALITQYLSTRIPALQSAQTQSQEAQRTATGGTPTLTSNGAAIFGGNAKPFYDGTTGKVEVPGDFAKTHKEQAENMKARGDTFTYDAFRDVTTVTLGTDDQDQIINIPKPPGREAGGPSPEIGQRGPTGGVISELHPEEWVLPKHARKRLGDKWLWEQTKNKRLDRHGSFDLGGPGPDVPWPTPWNSPGRSFHGDTMFAPMDQPDNPNRDIILPSPSSGVESPPRMRNPNRGDRPGVNPMPNPGPFSFQFGGPVMPFIPLSPGPSGPSPGPGPAPPPVEPAPKSVDTSSLPTPPAAAPDAHGGGAAPGKTADPTPINVGRTPANASPAEVADINAPGPTVDPNGQLTSPQTSLPNFGDQLTNAFLNPWGMQKDPSTGQIVGTGSAGSGEQMDPGTYLGKWAANFGTSLGSELINGVAGFFGLSLDNVYFQAFKQAVGFYSGKLGGAGQQVSPGTQQIVNSNIQGYQTLVDPATGTQYLIPNDMAAGGGEPGGAGGPLGDLSALPPGKAPEGGLQPNAIKTERAISAAFPEIQTIGGVRADPLKWHPEGLALDVMIPGQGGNNDPTTPAGLAEGNKIWAWLQAHASELGVDIGSSLWQKPDHYNHIHVAVYGKDNPGPGGDQGGGAAGGGAGGDTTTPPASGAPPLMVPGGARPSGSGGWGRGGAGGGIGSMFRPSGGAGGLSPVPNPGGGMWVPGPGATQDSLQADDHPGWTFHNDVPGGGRGGPLSGINSNSLFGGGGGIIVLPSSARTSMLSPFAGRRGSSNAPDAPYSGGSPMVHNQVYRAFRSAGFSDADWPAVVQILNHESNWDPTARNPGSGAAGLFQFLGHQNDKYASGYSSDPYAQATAGMQYIRDRYGTPANAWKFWQGHNWYDRGGLLQQGVTVMHHDQTQPDVVVPHAEAAQAVAALKAIPPPPPDMGPSARHMAPPPPPEVNIPAALPPPGPQAAPPPPQPQQLPAAPAPAAAPAPTPGPDVGKSYEHPGLKQGVTSGATTLGNIAATAAAAAGGGLGGAAGPLIAGLFQQGGKIVNDAINVGSAFASGFLHFGGTTQNPYGVMETRKDAPPQLGSDNRRVHMGNNYFASMDEWRRQNQLQDSQDMQAGMARIK